MRAVHRFFIKVFLWLFFQITYMIQVPTTYLITILVIKEEFLQYER